MISGATSSIQTHARPMIIGILACSYFFGIRISAAPASVRFIKSQSGPSGKIVDNRFIFDELRNRFVFPQDKSLTVYFEWEAAPGDHVLTAIWKDPEGRVASISPDVKMQTKTSSLLAYWVFELAPGMRGGIWTVEIRVDGEPAGSHSFELISIESPRTEIAAKVERLPTLEEIYASAGRSLVWVFKLDDAGHRIDTCLGFVSAPNQVATAFQAVDGGFHIQIEFANGRKTISDELWAYDRMQDWALVKADTGEVPPLRRVDAGVIPVGERYLVFNVEHEARVIGGVDIAGRTNFKGFGDRIQLSPSPSHEAAGGPLLSPAGLVAGIVGGSITPGSRATQSVMSVSPGLWSRLNAAHTATPIRALPSLNPAQAFTIRQLTEQGVLTPAVTPTPSLIYGGSARSLSKNVDDTTTRDTSEFSHTDQAAWIYTLWQKRDKTSKGSVSAKVYDSSNHLLVTTPAKKIALPEFGTTRFAFDFNLQTFAAGIYRVDILWNGQPAWRTYFTLTD